ncbi:MAG: RarD protein, superfamily transporter [Firmicutes bacterium]|nr:RarD protein, superfamily transporter [Bacillota bacterium]
MKKEQIGGVASAIGAFTLWGFLPIYWKLIQQVPALEILAHRIVWCLLFMGLVLFATRRIRSFRQETLIIVGQRKRFLGLISAAVILSLNWLIYIWAVNNNHIVETSLGYYINPLISVFLGVFVLKERLTLWQTVAVVLAGLGVLNLTVNFGTFPWIAVSLAVSFGLYGLAKKILNIGALTSIMLETSLMTPLALVYLSYLQQKGTGTFDCSQPVLAGLLIGAGIVTAMPMVLFSNSAIQISLTMLGFIQYLSPTIALFVGVFLYHEPFSLTHLVSFSLIWLALTIFSLSQTKAFAHVEATVMRVLTKGKQ